MDITRVNASLESFLRLERLVNSGSPSGFSTVNTPGVGYRVDDDRPFSLPIYDVEHLAPERLGGAGTLRRWDLPIHPEMAAAFEQRACAAVRTRASAVATSSGRTLCIEMDGTPRMVKLAYQGMLGRVTRRMNRAQVISATEVSRAYETAIDAGVLPATFFIYRETTGLAFDEDSELRDWGYVEREVGTYPAGEFIQVPAFSLFAEPAPGHRTLLSQIVSLRQELREPQVVFKHLFRPLVDLYFCSVTALGLQPEAHAQNVVILFDELFLPVGTALRDMESVDKDTPILARLGLLDGYTKTNYKFLEGDAYNYQIKHSFMFDFKLGRYLLEPLIEAWRQTSPAGVDSLLVLIRDHVQTCLDELPANFMPDGCWYDYEDVVHEGHDARTYVEHRNPTFRWGV